MTATNTFGLNGLISRHTSSGSTFYQFDERGNTLQQYDGLGNKLSSHEFDEFGALLSGSDALADPYSGFGTQMGYYYDSETGFYLLGHRYYDPQAGRFLNQDPIGMGDGLNQYAYTGNSPMSGSDPSGFCDPDDGNGWSWSDYADDVGSMFENEGVGVVNGGATKWGYFKSFKWDPTQEVAPFSSGESFTVPRSTVGWPHGWGMDGWWKGWFGQRKYYGPDILE